MYTCSKNEDCEAVECGESYCLWWKNGKCNDSHELSLQSAGIVQTCLKGILDKGERIIIVRVCELYL